LIDVRKVLFEVEGGGVYLLAATDSTTMILGGEGVVVESSTVERQSRERAGGQRPY